MTANYNVGPLGFQWQQRIVAETMLNKRWVSGIDIDDNTIPFYSFTNLQMSYSGETGSGSTWRAALAVNNAFDKNPPIIAGLFNRIGTQTGGLSSFDEFGRGFQLTLNVNF